MISIRQETPSTRRSRVNEAIHLALAVTASVTAFNSEAQIPCPITTTLNITDAQFNAVTCNNYSALNVLSPGGHLTNQYMATLNNYSGVTLTNNQQLDNFWDINNQSGGTITNTGTLYQSINSGIYSQGALINSGTMNSNGGIQSFGVSSTIVNQSTGIINNAGLLSNNNDSTFDNYGQINSTGELSNVGPLHNHSSGVINSQAGLNNYGPINNHGILNSSVNGIVHNPGTLNNYSDGTVNNGGYRFDNYNGTINNSGTFNNNTRVHG